MRRRHFLETAAGGIALPPWSEPMWDERAGTFLSIRRDKLDKIPVATIGSWIPLTAGSWMPSGAAMSKGRTR